MTHYISQDRNPETYTAEELTALLTGTAKPMWRCQKLSQEEMLENIMESRFSQEDWEAACDDPETDFEWFSCPINKWENLYKMI